jgi:hypothetical protein
VCRGYRTCNVQRCVCGKRGGGGRRYGWKSGDCVMGVDCFRRALLLLLLCWLLQQSAGFFQPMCFGCCVVLWPAGLSGMQPVTSNLTQADNTLSAAAAAAAAVSCCVLQWPAGASCAPRAGRCCRGAQQARAATHHEGMQGGMRFNPCRDTSFFVFCFGCMGGVLCWVLLQRCSTSQGGRAS